MIFDDGYRVIKMRFRAFTGFEGFVTPSLYTISNYVLGFQSLHRL